MTRPRILPALIDVNVALPLLIPQHVAHRTARDWIDAYSRTEIFWAWPTQLGVLRLLSQPRLMGSGAMLPEQALDSWDRLTAAAGMQQIRKIPPDHAQHLSRLVRGRAASLNIWTDAWLAALALSLDLEMATFDRGFGSFTGLKLRLLQS